MKISRNWFLVFVIKVLLATGIFYLALYFGVRNVGDDKGSTWLDYVSSGSEFSLSGFSLDDKGKIVFDTWVDLVDEAIGEIMNAGHYSVDLSSQSDYKYKFQRVCVENILVCVKVRFDWWFTYKDKYLYLASILHVLDFLDENSNTKVKSSSILNEIVIKSDWNGRRGYATKNFIEINTELVRSYREFFDLITHELWHVWDLGVVNGVNRQKDRVFTEFDKYVFAIDDPSISFYKLSRNSENVKKGQARSSDFVSRYGASDPFEDMAESFVMYMNHNAVFRYLALKNPVLKEKYNYLANFFDGDYLFSSVSEVSLYRDNFDYRVWDITRMNSD